MISRNQRYCGAAWEQVSLLADLAEHERKEEVSFAKGFPALLMTCGLCQAVAFASAKGHSWYLARLCNVMTSGTNEAPMSPDQLLKRSQEAEISSYMQMTRNALGAATWIKRFCEAHDPETRTRELS